MSEHSRLPGGSQAAAVASKHDQDARSAPAARGLGAQNHPSSNTGGSDLVDRRRLLAFGLDTLWLHVRVSEEQLTVLREKIEQGRYEWVRPGVNGYRYELVPENGLRVDIAPATNDAMGLYVMCGARWLRSRPATQWESSILSVLSQLQVTPLSTRVSRADFCADVLMPGGLEHFEATDIVARPRCHIGVYYSGETYTGFSVGKSDIRLRYYDKVFKAREDNELGYWLEHWGISEDQLGELGTVGRIEYQVRGDLWRDNNILSVGQLLERQGDLMRYLLDWGRLGGREQGQFHRRPDVDLWAWFRGAVRHLDLGAVGNIVRGCLKVPNVDRLVDQLTGLTASICCVLGLGSSGPWSVSQLWHFLNSGYNSDDYRQRVKERWITVNLAAMA